MWRRKEKTFCMCASGELSFCEERVNFNTANKLILEPQTETDMYSKFRLINLVLLSTLWCNVFSKYISFLPRQDPLGCKQSRVEAQPRTLFSVFDFCSLLSISSLVFKFSLSFQVSLISRWQLCVFDLLRQEIVGWFLAGRLKCRDWWLCCSAEMFYGQIAPNPDCLQWDQKMWNEYWCCVVYIISRCMQSGHLSKSFAKKMRQKKAAGQTFHKMYEISPHLTC